MENNDLVHDAGSSDGKLHVKNDRGEIINLD